MHEQERRPADQVSDGCEIPERIVRHLGLQMWEDGQHAGVGDAQRSAIGRGAGNLLGAGGAGSPGPVIHDHGLAKILRQFLGEHARGIVRRSAGGKRHHDAHRFARSLRGSDGG